LGRHGYRPPPAKALSSHNAGNPQVVIHPSLVERRYGSKVPSLMRWDYEAGREELTGKSIYSRGPIRRDHCPGGGGESLDMVALRAENIVRSIVSIYGVNLSEAPDFFLTKQKTDTPTVLPDGIPHVVIVSHNIFLIELYEKLHSWGGAHLETKCDWENASW